MNYTVNDLISEYEYDISLYGTVMYWLFVAIYHIPI